MVQTIAFADPQRGVSRSAIIGHSLFHAGALLTLGLLLGVTLTNNPEPWMTSSIMISSGAFVVGSILLLCTKIWETSKVRSFINSAGFYILMSGLLVLLALFMIGGFHLFHTGMWVLFGVYFFGTVFGITAGYHRWGTHKAYKAGPWFIRTVLFLGAMASQKDALWWIITHLIHHSMTERAGWDPHTPKEGFWWAHILWIWFPYQYSDEMWQKYANTRNRNPFLLEQLRYQRFAMWFSLLSGPAIFFVLTLITEASLLEAIIEAFKAFLLVSVLRTVLVYHTTFMVNSVSHAWGSRRYSTPRGEQSRDLVFWPLAILTLGEILHALHHKFPNVAVYGVRWNYIDLTGMILLALAAARRVFPSESLGLPYSLNRIPKERL